MGDLDFRISHSRRDEFGELFDGFNLFASAVQERLEAAERPSGGPRRLEATRLDAGDAARRARRCRHRARRCQAAAQRLNGGTMYICRLFNRDRPFEQIEARLLADGRDHDRPRSGGRLAAARSRRLPLAHPLHAGGRGRARCCCTDSSTQRHLPRRWRAPAAGEDVPIDCRRSFHLGALTILVDRAPRPPTTRWPRRRPHLPLAGRAPRAPSDWTDGAAAARRRIATPR